MVIISKTEDLLYDAMVSIGLNPKRQYPISKMHVDFAFPDKMVVVEIDGDYKRNAEGMQKLFNRKRVCEKEGWKVENFTAEEVYANPQKIAWRIREILNKLPTKHKAKEDSSRSKMVYPRYNYVSQSTLDRIKEENLREYRKKHPYRDNISILTSSNKTHTPKISRKNGWWIIFAILFIGLIVVFLVLNNKPDTNTKPNPTPTPKPVINPLIVEGSNTDVIITNNQDTGVSVNVTYRIYSNWFGINEVSSKVFDVDARTKKNFVVYGNSGCSTAPCSVSIINYTRA